MVRLGAAKNESDSESSSSDYDFLSRNARGESIKSEAVILDVSDPPFAADSAAVGASRDQTNGPTGAAANAADAIDPAHVVVDLSRTMAVDAGSASSSSSDSSDVETKENSNAAQRGHRPSQLAVVSRSTLPAGVAVAARSAPAGRPSSPASLLDLPDETLICVLTWLDVPSIGRMAQACKRFQALSDDLPMWRELSTKKDFFDRSGTTEELTRSYFITKFKKWRENQREAERKEAERRREQAERDRIDRCEHALLWTVLGRPYEWIAAVALIVVTILSVLKLDGRVDYEWWAILMPLLIVVCHIMFIPFVFDVAARRYRRQFDDDMGPSKFRWMSPVIYFIAFIVPLDYPSSPRQRVWVLGSTVLCGLFCILWYVRVGFSTALTWWAVFLPLLVECALISLLLLFESRERPKPLDFFVLQVVPICLFVFFLLTALKLDDHLPDTCSWYCVLVPLFAVKGLLIVASIVIFCLAYCGRPRYRRITRFHNPGPFWLSLAIFAFIFGPLLVFEVLLAKHSVEQTATTFAVIFVPIFIFLGCGVIGCVILNVVASRTD